MLTHEGRKHSFTDSIGGDSFTGYHDPYPHHLHNIIEEEEKSARNSIDKDFSTLERDKDDKASSNKNKITDSNATTKETDDIVDGTGKEGATADKESATTKLVVVEPPTVQEGTTEELPPTEEDPNEESRAEEGIHEETSTDDSSVSSKSSGIIQQSLEISAAEVNASKRKVSRK